VLQHGSQASRPLPKVTAEFKLTQRQARAAMTRVAVGGVFHDASESLLGAKKWIGAPELSGEHLQTIKRHTLLSGSVRATGASSEPQSTALSSSQSQWGWHPPFGRKR